MAAEEMSSVPCTLLEQCVARVKHLEEQARELEGEAARTEECATRKLFMDLPNLSPERQQEEWEKLDREEVNSRFLFAPAAEFCGIGILLVGDEETHEMKEEQAEYVEDEMVKEEKAEDVEVIDLEHFNEGTNVQIEQPGYELDRGWDEKGVEAAKLKKHRKSVNSSNKTNYGVNAHGKDVECPMTMCNKSFSRAGKLKEHISVVHLSQDIADMYIDKSGTCNVDDCGKEFPVHNQLVRHIGTTHNKVVEIMEQKGIPVPNVLLGVKKRKRKFNR